MSWLRELEVYPGGGPTLGMVFDTETLHTQHGEKTHELLTTAITGVLALDRVHGRLLELPLGHCNFYGPASRESLSCSCIRFVQRHFFEARRSWQSCLNELRCFRTLEPRGTCSRRIGLLFLSGGAPG